MVDRKLDYIRGDIRRLEATFTGNQQKTISYLEIIGERIEELKQFSDLSLDVFSSVIQEQELKEALDSSGESPGYHDIQDAVGSVFPVDVLPRQIYLARKRIYRVFTNYLIDFKSLTFYPLSNQESLSTDAYRKNLHQTPFNGSFANLLGEWKAFPVSTSGFQLRPQDLFQKEELTELIKPKNLLFVLKHYTELTLLFDPELPNRQLDTETKGEINQMCQHVVRLKQASREMRRALPVAWKVYKEYLRAIKTGIFYQVSKVQNKFINESFPEGARFWWKNKTLSGKDPLVYSKSTCQETDLEECYNEEDYLDIYEYGEFLTRHGKEIHRNESNESLIKRIPLEDTSPDDSGSSQRGTRQVLYPYQYPPDAFKMTPEGIYGGQLKVLFQSGDAGERESFYELASYKRPFYDFVFQLGRPYYTVEKEEDSTDCSKWQRECTQAWMTYEHERGGEDPNGRPIIPVYYHSDYSSYEGDTNTYLTVTSAKENLEGLYLHNNFFPLTSLDFRNRLFNQGELFRYCYRNQWVRDTAGGGKIYKCLVLLPFDNRGSPFKSYHIRSTPAQEWHLKNPALLLGATGYANRGGSHIPMRKYLIALENPEEVHGGFHQRPQASQQLQRCETWGEPIFCKSPRSRKYIKTDILMEAIRKRLYSYRRELKEEIDKWYRSPAGRDLLNGLSQAKFVLKIFTYSGYVKNEKFSDLNQLLETMQQLFDGRERLNRESIQEPGETEEETVAKEEMRKNINDGISWAENALKTYSLGGPLLQVLERAPSGFDGDRFNVFLPKLPDSVNNYGIDDAQWFHEDWMEWFDTWWAEFVRWKEWVVDLDFDMPEDLPLEEYLKYENLESAGSLIPDSSAGTYNKDHQFLGLGFGEYFQEVRDLLRQIDAENSDFMPSDESCLGELKLGEFYDAQEGHKEDHQE